jgi:uncharacterized membrane protein YesL
VVVEDDRKEGQMSPISVLRKATMDWYEEAFLYALLSAIWVLSLATVVLTPVVTVGIFHLAHEQVHDRIVSWGKFKEGVRLYWKDGLKLGIVSYAITLVSLLDLYFYLSRQSAAWGVVAFIWGYFILLWFGMSMYMWPMVVGMESPSLMLMFRNAFFMVMAYPIYTLVLLFFLILLGAFSLLLPFFLIGFWPAWFVLVSERAFQDRIEDVKRRKRKGGTDAQ